MAGVNKIIIIGNLGRDPDLKYGQSSGKAVCRFSLAVNEKRGGEDVTEWFNIVCFDRTAEIADQYLSKGAQVYIEGRLQTRKYQGKDGSDKYATEVLASNLTMLGGGRSAENTAGSQSAEKPREKSQQRGMAFDGRDVRSATRNDDPFAGDFGPPPTDEDMPF